MCDNLDVEGKRGVLWGGQSLNTVVGSCEPARDKLDSNILVIL
jgi:hypothetical protein